MGILVFCCGGLVSRKGNSCAVEFSGSGPFLNWSACELVRLQLRERYQEHSTTTLRVRYGHEWLEKGDVSLWVGWEQVE